MGGPDNFAVMYDAFIDEAYREVRERAPAASILRPARRLGLVADFRDLVDITDDSIEARCAAPRSSPS